MGRTGFRFNSVVEYSVCLDPEMMSSRKLVMGPSGFAGEEVAGSMGSRDTTREEQWEVRLQNALPVLEQSDRP